MLARGPRQMIFHVPAELHPETRPSASQIRPVKMQKAFEELGYQVDLVAGEPASRRAMISAITQKIREGVRYDFCYVESSTMPTLLTTPNHLPLNPFLDYGFWFQLQRAEIPIGVFYRDIYWKFPSLIGKVFYELDHGIYGSLMKKIFLPSDKMSEWLPTSLKKKSLALPPGCEKPAGVSPAYCGGPIHLLYVGGVGRDYNISSLIQTCGKSPFVKLTLCCRSDEWQQSGLSDLTSGKKNISVVHASGSDLNALYAHAHLGMLSLEASAYREFAVPFKLFEYASWQLPILAMKGTEASRIIDENNIGFIVENNESSLEAILEKIYGSPDVLDEPRKNVEAFSRKETWLARARTVETNLRREQKL
jgi:hypothetical protein